MGQGQPAPSPRLFVSGTEFSRSMGELVRGAAEVRTVCAPTTVDAVRNCAYQDAEALRTVVMDARGASLERIGNRCFCGAGVRKVRLPRSLKLIGSDAFL